MCPKPKMAFIRVKGHGNHRYAYWVSEEWTKEGPRQKVSEYLGKVISEKPEKEIKESDFIGDKEIKEMAFSDFVRKLAALSLLKCGFVLKGKRYLKEIDGGRIDADLEKGSFSLETKGSSGKKRDIVIQINDGFMCKKSMENLLFLGRGKKAGTEEVDESFYSEERIDGYELAKLVVAAGLKPEQQTFLTLFERCIGKKLDLKLDDKTE
ncbi:MAG: hypothetical protein NTV63_00115 [Candidatus Woesearchaeota archaeon]|nr:hypothetical protein [Candidatus Woesearchaeota archaeon]